MVDKEAEKQVIIGTDNEMINMLYGTGVKGSPETSESTTPTFTGAVVQGLSEVPYTLEIDKLRYEDVDTHIALSQKLEKMMAEPDNITVIDTIYPKGSNPYQVIDKYFSCICTAYDDEVKADDNTTESLKFKASKRVRDWKKLQSDV